MADDNNKKKEYTKEQKKYLQKTAGQAIVSPSSLKARGIPEVGPPIREGASADSTGYFAKKIDDLKKMQAGVFREFRNSDAPKTYIPKEIKNRPESPINDLAFIQSPKGIIGKIRSAREEAEDDYFRQSKKGEKGIILNYDKDGYYVGPFGGDKKEKKEMKPAAIVAPVKRPSEAVMKKVTGKK